jgi:hypothetical protein
LTIHRKSCDLISRYFSGFKLNFTDIKFESEIKHLFYKFAEFDYRPKITENFTHYFLWNKIQKDFISNNESNSPIIDFINTNKIEYKFSGKISQENIPDIFTTYYIDYINFPKSYDTSKSFNTLYKKLYDKTNTNWHFLHIEYTIKDELINWYNCQYFIYRHYFPIKSFLVFNISDYNNIITNCNPFVCYCDENYINYKENDILIIKKVMQNSSLNLELKEIEINRQLNDLLDSEVFSYLTKHILFSTRYPYLKFAISFGEYNIIITDENFIKYELKENWAQNMI